MITRRPGSVPLQAPSASYQGLLRAAEAHPDEYFTISGDRLALLIRELEGRRRSRRRAGADA